MAAAFLVIVPEVFCQNSCVLANTRKLAGWNPEILVEPLGDSDVEN